MHLLLEHSDDKEKCKKKKLKTEKKQSCSDKTLNYYARNMIIF